MGLENWMLLVAFLTAIVWPAVAFAAYASYKRCRAVVPERNFPNDSRFYPRVSVVIPARDEEDNIEATVRSLLAQEGVALEIIVIDDHSSDRTGEVINRLAAEDPRVRALRDPPLKAGWLGKVSAMAFGAQLATGEYILFTDADIKHHPGSTLAAVREMEEHGLSLLSMMPLFIWKGLWENAAAPAFLLGVTGFLSGAIHDPDSEDALAIGAFILVDAARYRALGGHQAVKTEMLDDVMLARHFKARGEPVAFRAAPECLSVRPYNGARAVFDGHVKNCVALFGDNFWLAVPMAFTFSVGGASVLAAPYVGLWLQHWLLFALGAIVYVQVWATVLLCRGYMKTHWLKLAAFVICAPLLLASTAVATYHAVFYGAVLWRGRAIRVG